MKRICKYKLFWIAATVLIVVVLAVIACSILSKDTAFYAEILPDGTLRLRKIVNFKGDTLEIPDEIDNLPITSISVTAISSSDIDYQAVKRLILPRGIRSLTKDIFSNLTNLEEVTIGSALEEFDPRVFRNLNYVSVHVDENNVWFDTVEGCLVRISGSGFELCYGDHIPNGTTVIGEYSLSNRTFETVTIPESVIYINKYAFANCTNLKTIDIPGNVSYILGYAFSGCSGLENVNIQDGVISIGQRGFENCENLSSISLPESLRTVGHGAFTNTAFTDVPYMGSVTELPAGVFQGCDKMVSVHIPEGIQIFNATAFSWCSNLESVAFPSTMRIFENVDPFRCCYKLAELTVADNNLNYYSSDNCIVDRQTSKVVAVSNESIVPNEVKTIGESAFSNRGGLVCVAVPDGVERIEHNAFVYCYNLQALYIPTSVTATARHIIGSNAENMHIYCEAESQPDGWDENWNNENYPVTWGVSRERFEELIK